jgi:NAD(P)-dependent dehydrogenase (short-subunit alcohol dehydrogenase family)
MDLQLKGKTAIVTGATAGIGFAIARGLSEEGFEVTIPGRTGKKLKEALSSIPGPGGNSGPGSIPLYANLGVALPADTLTIRDAFPNETVVFPFGELTPTERQGLAPCFTGTTASR